MRTYEVTITGKTPLLLHPDDIDWADKMDAWKNNPENKKTSKAGDDRSPAWRWVGNAMNDGEKLALSSDMVMACLMQGGAMVPVPGAKGNKTFKSQTQSGMASATAFWTLQVNGAEVPMSRIKPLLKIEDFATHREKVSELGFALFVKRAKVGTSKHIRVRPRFRAWGVIGRLVVHDDQLTEQVLADVLHYAGTYKGLGDWRPGGRTPGAFGTFSAEIKKVK